MTVSDSDRPHSQLARYEDVFCGYPPQLGGLTVDTSRLRVDPKAPHPA
ncbi:hypothetical protein AB5J52_27140 [Streptomyces sp. R39]|uniref:Uncharacterized protein n=1 Tax=Streptomyces sp. R39 TaxID=3238631 RepID=A0AB39QST6_9ACTN